jgi:hypothetical protein
MCNPQSYVKVCVENKGLWILGKKKKNLWTKSSDNNAEFVYLNIS